MDLTTMITALIENTEKEGTMKKLKFKVYHITTDTTSTRTPVRVYTTPDIPAHDISRVRNTVLHTAIKKGYSFKGGPAWMISRYCKDYIESVVVDVVD